MLHQEAIGTVDREIAVLTVYITAQFFLYAWEREKIIQYLVVVLPKSGFERIISQFILKHFIWWNLLKKKLEKNARAQIFATENFGGGAVLNTYF